MEENSLSLYPKLLDDIVNSLVFKKIISTEQKEEQLTELSHLSRKAMGFGRLVSAIEGNSEGSHFGNCLYYSTNGPLYILPYLVILDSNWSALFKQLEKASARSCIISGILKTKYIKRSLGSYRSFLLIRLPTSPTTTIFYYLKYSAMGAAQIVRLEINNSRCIKISHGGNAITKEELEESIKDREGNTLEEIQAILSKEKELQASSNMADIDTLEIASLPTPNLAHQFWNQYLTSHRIGSFLSAYHPEKKFFFSFYETTNYFPTESLALHFSTTAQNIDSDLYVSRGQLIYIDRINSYPSYEQTKHVLTSYLRSNAQTPITIIQNKGNKRLNTNDKKKKIIFSLKAGSALFANTQFPIEEAISITIKTIQGLNEASPNTYHFIIDGMTAPYIPQGKHLLKDTIAQRKHFKESEEHWFQILRERIPDTQLSFINGMNLLEKYPYYQAASKFIRFGTGSYAAVWNALKESNASNHLTVINKSTNPTSNIHIKPELFTTEKISDAAEATAIIADFLSNLDKNT